MHKIDIQGKRFGKLIALECVGESKYRCICDCGKEKIIRSGALRYGDTRSCGCLRSEYARHHIVAVIHRPDVKAKLSKARTGKPLSANAREKVSEYMKVHRKGSLNPAWKGGITPERFKIRNSARYAEWRLSVYRRDKFRCVLCGAVGGKLNAHHVRSFSKYPDLRFDIDNGVTLCEKCHKDLHVNLRVSSKAG